MSTPPASHEGTARWMMGDSFWRDFAMRVAYRGKSMRGWYAQRGKSQERKRIMNRLFISFSSVKLLRMAHPTEVLDSFSHHRVMYMYTASIIAWEYFVFRCCYNLFLLATVACLLYETLCVRQIFFRVHKNLFFIFPQKIFYFSNNLSYARD